VSVCREVHDFCTLLGFGADAICPYLVYETMSALRRQNKLEPPLDDAEIYSNYIIAVANGIAKVMAKMGISTLHSYKASNYCCTELLFGHSNRLLSVCLSLCLLHMSP